TLRADSRAGSAAPGPRVTWARNSVTSPYACGWPEFEWVGHGAILRRGQDRGGHQQCQTCDRPTSASLFAIGSQHIEHSLTGLVSDRNGPRNGEATIAPADRRLNASLVEGRRFGV